MVGTSNEWDPEMAIDMMAMSKPGMVWDGDAYSDVPSSHSLNSRFSRPSGNLT